MWWEWSGLPATKSSNQVWEIGSDVLFERVWVMTGFHPVTTLLIHLISGSLAGVALCWSSSCHRRSFFVQWIRHKITNLSQSLSWSQRLCLYFKHTIIESATVSKCWLDKKKIIKHDKFHFKFNFKYVTKLTCPWVINPQPLFQCFSAYYAKNLLIASLFWKYIFNYWLDQMVIKW